MAKPARLLLLPIAVAMATACGKQPSPSGLDAGAHEDASSAACLPAPARPLRLASPAPESYPARWPTIPSAELEARVKQLRVDNPGTWLAVSLGTTGFVTNLITRDRCLTVNDGDEPDRMTDADMARWSAFVLANAAAFGLEDAAALTWERSPRTPQAQPAMTARQRVGPDTIGKITIMKSSLGSPKYGNEIAVSGHFWPGARPLPPAKIDPAPLPKPFVGRTMIVVVMTPGMPCDPLPGTRPGPSCGQAPSQRQDTVVIDEKMLSILPRLDIVGTEGAVELRRTFQVTLGHDEPSVGLPATFDALTGESVTSCRKLACWNDALP